jgi:linoleate 10R-lipoxygenase
VLHVYIKTNLEKLKTSIWSLGGLFSSVIHLVTGQQDNSHIFLQSLLDKAPANMTIESLAHNVLALLVGAVANWAMAATHVINFYLDDERSDQRRDIEILAKDRSTTATARLAGYAREALRFDPQAPGIFRDAARDVVVEEGRGLPPVSIHKGERFFVSLAHANMDVSISHFLES